MASNNSSEDPWKNIDQKYKIGDLVKGKVTKLASFGAFVQLQDDIDGLVHISQFSEDHVAKVKDVLKVGQEVEARVIKVDKIERRIGLSIKAANYSEEELRKEAEAFDTLASRRRHGRPGEGLCRRRRRLSTGRSQEIERRTAEIGRCPVGALNADRRLMPVLLFYGHALGEVARLVDIAP